MNAPVRAGARRAKRQGMDLKDPKVADRLDEMGVPADLAARLSVMGVGLHLVERLHEERILWAFPHRLVRTPALGSPEDVAALHSLVREGLSEDEVEQWARLGSLNTGYRLHLMNVPLNIIRSFPLDPQSGLDSFLRMMQTAKAEGIQIDDMFWWHTAGVLMLTPPYLNPDLWVSWRAAAVHHLGMRPAALAAAAGMDVSEAVDQWARGEFDAEAMKMMAALRATSVF